MNAGAEIGMGIEVGIGIILFILYWCLLPRLVDIVLETPKLKHWHWALVGTFNAVIVFSVSIACSNVLTVYLIMMTLMLIEFIIFYKDKICGIILCALSCGVHVLSTFIIAISMCTVFTGLSPYEIVASDKSFVMAAGISFAMLDVIILGVIKLVPLSKVRLINQHREQQGFIIAWLVVNNVFLIYGANNFANTNSVTYALGNYIAMAVTALICLYIVLFFSIKTSSILGYKQKNEVLKQAIHQEQRYRNSMTKDAIAYYEVNVTKDLIIKGFEDKHDEIGDSVYKYSEMLKYMTKKLIYCEDVDEFVRTHTIENILELFKNGQSEFTAEYRRNLENGEISWVRAIVNLVEDAVTGDVSGFVCIKNIDSEKKNQLALQHLAEHDPLTGLYNKSVTRTLIEENLLQSQSSLTSAFFMIDVDNFKQINDHLGHVFGDAVLCELAERLVKIFRSNDIVGRIGGDEFIVFLKDGAIGNKVEEKAEEICRAFNITYKGSDGDSYTISSSVGIALFPKDGRAFTDLYSHADIALYEAKNLGKNTYKIYSGSKFLGYTDQRTEIQPMGNVSQKGFRQNRIEYIFKMLYHSDNPVTAIHLALELVASHFSFERGYIFETSKDGKTTSNTFEWCAEGVTQEINNLQEVPIEVVETANSHFKKNGTFILKSIDDVRPMERAVLEPQGIKSMFQFGIFDKSKLLGFIGFDNCRSEIVPTDSEIDEMATICNILATFFVKQHIDEEATKDLMARQEVMNNLDNYIYVIDSTTFEVLFMNEKIQKLMKDENSQSVCYSFFRGKSSQCEDCPLRKIKGDGKTKVVSEVYNEKLKIWMEATAATMKWTDGNDATLVTCVDISRQKRMYKHHVQQLEHLVYVDDLTGCPTYYKFKKDARRILDKQKNATHLLIKMDIDKFKLINQSYGYEKGNEILCNVAKAFEKTARNEDEIFARVANDEFIALFTIENTMEIDQLYSDFLQNFEDLIGHSFGFKCSFPHGRYVIYPKNKKRIDINDMFEKVNTAHKEAKLEKALDFMEYDERMTEKAMRAKEIENSMEEALKNEEFIVYLQPKYYLDSETIGGAEALVRWDCLSKELFLPGAFINIFEQSGFITKLDFYIFEKVCTIIKKWIDDGIKPMVISVNFSRLHLNNKNFVKELCEIVDGVGISREYLEIEITETVVYDNIKTLEILLDDIHKGGFSMSMDDFGSGYSSLGMLKNLPVDVIKMDRSFFANQKEVERSKTVVGCVIQMATKLGIRTVAEGVESQEHIDFLRELQCDLVQGYYYAKPMPIEDFTALIVKQS